jgi:hypothetical protein
VSRQVIEYHQNITALLHEVLGHRRCRMGAMNCKPGGASSVAITIMQ